MSVWVYKDGEKELIAPEFLQGHLATGWSVTDGDEVFFSVNDDKLTRLSADEYQASLTEGEEPEVKPDIASDAFFGLSNQQIREKAFKAGIVDCDKLRIHTLKEMLG